jgi:hypothetical protein
MGWLFGKKVDPTVIVAQANEMLVAFENEKLRLQNEKDSLLRRQVEIWSVSSSDSNQGMEVEYKKAATGVAFAIKRVLCLEEHVKKMRMAIFHAEKGDTSKLEKLLEVIDPCANITQEVPKVQFQAAPSPVTQE